MDIGIPKEKKGELRVSLIPSDIGKLVEDGHSVFVEAGVGCSAGFSDREYEENGAKIVDSVWRKELIVRVKTGAADPIKENQILMAYLHIEKNQNPELLSKLIEKQIISYAFEEIRDAEGNRLVNLGYEAGLVGMYEGLGVFGRILERNGMINTFKSLTGMKQIGKKEALKKLSKLNLDEKPNVIIMGNGNVSRGVQKILKQAGISPQVFGAEKTAQIAEYLQNVDILVNAVVWHPGEPHIVTRKMLKLMKKTALILDISCDEGGAVQTCIPTKWTNPTYEVDGITHFCIDNLPIAIARDSSIHLSSMILPFVLKVANRIELQTGQMTKNGIIQFKKAN